MQLSLALAAAAVPAASTCLDEEYPLLSRPYLRTIVVEVNSWHSSRIVASIGKILLEERLGYQVKYNKVDSNVGAYRRAATPGLLSRGRTIDEHKKDDGKALRDAVESGRQFGYVCFEVWNEVQYTHLDRYAIQEALVRLGGSVGYLGRSGFYVPTEFAGPPYGLELYRSVMNNKSDAQSRSLFEKVKESSFVVNCSSGDICHCCKAVEDSCQAWCPSVVDQQQQEAGDVPLPLFKVKGFDKGVAEEIIQNNNLSMAVKYVDDELLNDATGADFEALIETKMASPMAFFHWVPSLTILRLDVRRMFLPQEEWCGAHSLDEGRLGSWKCDFPMEHLSKIGSANLVRDAPLVKRLLYSMKLNHSDDIRDVLHQSAKPAASPGDLVNASIARLMLELDTLQQSRPGDDEMDLAEEIACKWLRDNPDKWKRWVSRDIPFWADMSDEGTLLVGLALSFTIVFLAVFVWERFWLSTGLFGKTIKDACNCWFHRRKRGDYPVNEDVRWGGARLRERIERIGMELHQDTPRGAQSVLEDPASALLRTLPPACVVDFRSPEWKVIPGAGKAILWLDRTGNLTGKVSVRVHAHAGDAKAGLHYRFPEEGLTITFEPWQSAAGVPVEAFFVPTVGLEYANQRLFYLELTHVVSGDAMLARPGAAAHVRIASEGKFLGDGMDDANPRRLIRQWIYLVFVENKMSFCQAAACCLWISFHKVFVKTLSLQVLVDYVLVREDYWMVPIIVALTIPSMLLVRWSERAFITVSRQGPITKKLRDIIYKKFWRLAMHQHFREAEQHAKWITSLVRVNEITQAWLTVFAIVGHIATLLFGIVVAMVATTQWGMVHVDAPRMVGLLLMLLMGAICFCLIFLTHRAQHESDLVEQGELRLDTLVEQFVWTLRSWTIITEQRPHMHRVEAVLEEFLDTNEECRVFVKRGVLTGQTSSWISEYFTCAMTVFIMFYGILAAADREHHGQGTFSIGSFYALVGIVGQAGDAMTKISLGLLSFNRSGAVLRTLTDLLDLPEDEHELYKASCAVCQGPHHRGLCSTPTRDCFDYSIGFSPQAWDLTPHIELDDVCFQYHPRLPMVLEDCRARLPLGFAFAICGPRNSGKLTLLRILSHGLAPTRGKVRVPPPLRVSLLDGALTFIPGLSVVDNMKLGIRGIISNDDLDVLCRALPLYGFAPEVSGEAPSDGPDVCCRVASASSRMRQRPSELLASTGTRRKSVSQSVELVPHLTTREQFTMQLARALLRDADLLLINFREMPEDEWTARLYIILCLWQRAGGLAGLLRELRSLEDEASRRGWLDAQAAQPEWQDSHATFHEVRIGGGSCSSTAKPSGCAPVAAAPSLWPGRNCLRVGQAQLQPEGDLGGSPAVTVSSPVRAMMTTSSLAARSPPRRQFSERAEMKIQSLRESWALVPLDALVERVRTLSAPASASGSRRRGFVEESEEPDDTCFISDAALRHQAISMRTLVVLPSDSAKLLESPAGGGFNGLIRLSEDGSCSVVMDGR